MDDIYEKIKYLVDVDKTRFRSDRTDKKSWQIEKGKLKYE